MAAGPSPLHAARACGSGQSHKQEWVLCACACAWSGPGVTLSRCQDSKVWGQVDAGLDWTHGVGRDLGVIPMVGGLPPGDSGGQV